MCGRTSLAVPQSVLEERFDATALRPIVPRYNIAPGDGLAVVRNEAPGEIDHLEWGLLPGWVDDPDGWVSPINARAESVHEKPAFRSAFRERRCLVLADGFYEWAGDGGRRTPYRVEVGERDPFAMAGLWESWGSDGDARVTVTIVTTEANGIVAPIHDRMPVVLAPDEEADWLRGDDPGALRGLLDPAPDDRVRAFEVSRAVNDPGNDDPAVIEPVSGGQSGLGDFA